MSRQKGWKVWLGRSANNHRCRWSGKYGAGQQTFVFKPDAADLARIKRADFQRMDAGLPPTLRPTAAITVAEFGKIFLRNSKREKSARTHNNFDHPGVDSFCDMHGLLALAALVDTHVRDWKFKVEADYNGTTASMYFRVVRTFLNAAVKAGHLTKSPALYVPRPTEGRGGRAMKDEELLPLMKVAEDILRKAGTFSMNTMLRIEEVTRFDWSWVWTLPGDKWMGRIPAELRKTRGKVAEDCIFPINKKARKVMGKRQLSGRVFPWAPVTIQHQMTRARKKAKLPDDISFHSFRHTGASRYLRDGGHMEDLLKTHLWKDPRSLLRYVHVDEPTLWKRFSAMNYPV